MKKLILSILLSLFSLIIHSQTYSVNISGIVLDDLTQEPISNQQMIISVDSLTSGFIYYNIVLTDSSGYFSDIMEVPLNVSGVVEVSTYSCDIIVSQFEEFSSDEIQLVFDFYICNNPTGNNCEAFFGYYSDELPLSIQFIDLSTGLPTNWYWDFGDGTTSNEQNPLHIFIEEGEYNTSLFIEDDSCNSEFEMIVSVEYDTISDCDAFFTYESGSEPLSIEFFDESMGDVDTWVWDFGDGYVSYNQNPIHNYEVGGTYMVSLFIQTTDLCMSYYEDYINVYGDTTSCVSNFNIELDTLNNTPNTYIFSDLSEGDVTSWYWEFGDGDFSIEQNPIHVYSDSGTYYPCLTITSSNNNSTCSSTECKQLTTLEYFNFGGQAFIGDYPININQGDSANIAIAYLFKKVNQSWYYMDQRKFWEYGYYWFINKPLGEYLIVANLTENSMDYDYYAPSYYPDAISWENANTFMLSNNQQFAVNISLHELAPYASGIGSISGTVIGGNSCDTNYNITTYNILVQLFNSTNQLISYAYTDADGAYEFIGLDMGNYFIKPEYTGKYTEETSLTLTDGTPNLSDIQLIVNCSNPLGVEEVVSEYISYLGKIYPNPLVKTGNLKIAIKESSIIKIDIFNQFGRILYSNKTSLLAGTHTINFPTTQLPEGMYFARITTDDNIGIVRKFIKTK